ELRRTIDGGLFLEHPISMQPRDEARAMREQLGRLLDERGCPGVLAKDRERGGTGTEVSDYIHELDDDAHDWLSRLGRRTLPERRHHPSPSSKLVDELLGGAIHG